MHRLLLRTALVFLTLLGSVLGVLMLVQLAGWMPIKAWQLHRLAHGQFQVFGFVVMFTLGIGYAILGRLPRWMILLSWIMCSGGVLLGAFFPQLLAGRVLMVVGVLPFLALVWPQPWLVVAGLWLVAAAATGSTEWALQGFACNFVFAMAWRMHPALLRQAGMPKTGRAAVMLLWNLGLLTGLAWIKLLSTVLLVLGMRVLAPAARPAREGWSPRVHLQVAYVWLVAACLLEPGSSLARHALGAGFLLTMILAMAYRIVPALEKRELRWPAARSASLWLLQAGTLLRLGGQATGQMPIAVVGGALQLAAASWFAANVWLTLRR